MPNYKNAKIYKLVNSNNDKIYIGSTQNALSRRMWSHQSRARAGATSPVYEEMRKVGIENFKIELIENFPCESKIELEKREFRIMKKYIMREKELLNSTTERGKYSTEAKWKMSAAKKGKVASDETKRKISSALKGKVASDETKRKISAALKGKYKSIEHRRKIGVSSKGKLGVASRAFKRGCVARQVDETCTRWAFKWQENGKQCSKSFSVKKYGEKRAKRLAEKVQNEIYPIKPSK